MTLDRRRMLAMSAVAGAAAPAAVGVAHANPSMLSTLGVEAKHLGVVPGSSEDQTRVLQRAIDQSAGARIPLLLAPGTYRVGGLKLPAGAQLVGVRGATRLTFTGGASLVESVNADRVSISGIIFDGGGKSLPEGRGLVHLSTGRGVRIVDCEITSSGRQGLFLERIEGEVRSTAITAAANTGLFSIDARGLMIAGNTVRGCGNNGIQVWRSEPGDDGTMIVGNRIEEIAARNGGSGQNGNAINVFRAANVQVTQNRISGVAFSAVRGNAASNMQVMGNSCSGCGEVAIYAEFGFEGVVIANNTIDGAALGIAVTNFNHGGRLAIVQGNIIRHLLPRRPRGTDPNDGAGIGIGVEADTIVSGNIIEDAPTAGMSIGWGPHMRDVAVTSNIIRGAGVGIAVSVSQGAGAAVIADNLIADARGGAIVGMDLKRPVTGDLAKGGAERYAQLVIGGNRVR